MHPVRFFREMTRVPTWRLEGESLILPSPLQAFVMHRRELNDTCALNFTRTMRLNQAIPGVIVSPDGLHVAPTIKVELVPRVKAYDSGIHFDTTTHAAEARFSTTPVSNEERRHSRQFGKEVLVPRVAKTYDIYGLSGHHAKPRCMRLPMRVDDKITKDNADYDDRPFIGLVASDGHDEVTMDSSKEIYISRRTNGGVDASGGGGGGSDTPSQGVGGKWSTGTERMSSPDAVGRAVDESLNYYRSSAGVTEMDEEKQMSKNLLSGFEKLVSTADMDIEE